MKRYEIHMTVFLLVAGFAVGTAVAQQPGPHRMGPMMHADSMGMPMMMHRHGQMMQDPLHRAGMQVFLLPALTEPLELSEPQQARLQNLKQQFVEVQQQRREQIQQREERLRALFEGEAPAPDRVEALVMEIARLRGEERQAAYRTLSEMRGALTESQRTRLAGMSPQEMHQLMMQNLTMMDMMQMMQILHGDAMASPMMNRRGMMHMMQGGMMPQGGPMPHPEQ